MKKLSVLLALLVLFANVCFAQDNKSKAQTPPKTAILQPKDNKSGVKKDSVKHLKKLPPPDTSNK